MPLPRRNDSGKSRLDPVSRDAGRLEEEHCFFCPARFYGVQFFFVEGADRSERSEHIPNVNENDEFRPASPIYRTRTEPAYWPTNERAEYLEQNQTTPPGGLSKCLVGGSWAYFMLLYCWLHTHWHNNAKHNFENVKGRNLLIVHTSRYLDIDKVKQFLIRKEI
jgi:hypothetical protein